MLAGDLAPVGSSQMSEPRDPAPDGPADRLPLPGHELSTDPQRAVKDLDPDAGMLFPPVDDPGRVHRHDPTGAGPGPDATDEHLFAGLGGPPGPSTPSEDDDPVADGEGRGASSFLRELPVLLVIAFVLAFLLRTFVVQVFYIPSSSMEPTLRIDDRMVVEKITYRFREPQRGEVVVFEGENFAVDTAAEPFPTRIVRGIGQFLGVVPASARDFVKRVIGLPGDEVLIEAGQVYVNGEPIDEPYVVYEDGADFGPVTVPDGALFFLGDNRPNSSDSRRSLGYVPLDHVVGRAAFIIWPADHAGSLMGVEHDEVPDAPPPDTADTDEVLSDAPAPGAAISRQSRQAPDPVAEEDLIADHHEPVEDVRDAA